MTNTTQWDRIVKLTHWSVAILFLINYFVTKAGSSLHQWVGYTIVGLVVVRLLWGGVTRSPARLSQFLPSFSKAVAHLNEVVTTRRDEHQGHNPAGAIMIWCMWSGLLVTGLSGYLMENPHFSEMDWLHSVHVITVNVTFTCVCIHILAVWGMSRLTGRSYLRSMLPTQKIHK
ncbi:cytochrome b/b6 domain-containing protein [Vibrio zhugei]|uniref:Cytochrome b/b6 domain-containing protein n=1 Tax=Vibrio zhugei TaxID=2479546 RepID=A0ABV7CA86_9VIBR|nr:cytochrome b/b6 domain-containing protein [Vibrio zhugei]